MNRHEISDLTKNFQFWRDYFNSNPSNSVHLAVFVEPFLSFILDGVKTIESRFSITKRPPFNSVSPGDIILVKKSGGPIMAVCHASYIWYYKINKQSLGLIRSKFSGAICATDEFWESKANCAYATLIKIDNVVQIPPVPIDKRDRRGWVVLDKEPHQLEFNL